MIELPDAIVTKTDVYIDGHKLPGYIAENSVTIQPGGHKDMNKLTVTFLVGNVTVKDTDD